MATDLRGHTQVVYYQFIMHATPTPAGATTIPSPGSDFVLMTGFKALRIRFRTALAGARKNFSGRRFPAIKTLLESKLVRSRMKLLVFAHTPPPHHGQSYMVQLMLGGFGGDRRKKRRKDSAEPETVRRGVDLGIDCYHVNARLSRKLEEIGDLRIGKFIHLIGYCFQAIWCRYRYGVTNFYYIPAPGKRSALYRDWLVMLLCRPFFKKIILHWHAAGLAKWLETSVQVRTRSLTYRFLKQANLSIVLSRYNRADAEKLFSRQVTVVSNGIPDPCPDFAGEVLTRRRKRFAARQKLIEGKTLTSQERAEAGGDPEVLKVLYLAHCTREKGLFDAVDGVLLTNRRLAVEGVPVTLRMFVTGLFVTEAERAEFEARLKRAEAPGAIQYLGFVSGDQKQVLLREADLFCFPTFYRNENQPVNLIEAMAFGLPILTTRWRSLPELFPAGYTGLVDIQSPGQIVDALVALMTGETGEFFRETFLSNFTLEGHLSGLAEALAGVEVPADQPTAK
jgi:glycosyltransferase involved in cell wall biosynthesis